MSFIIQKVLTQDMAEFLNVLWLNPQDFKNFINNEKIPDHGRIYGIAAGHIFEIECSQDIISGSAAIGSIARRLTGLKIGDTINLEHSK